MSITYTSVTKPRYGDAASKTVVVTVQFGHISKPVEFRADPADTEPHGRQIYADCVAGKYGPIAPYPTKASK